jgi:hypothetical protein
VDRFDNGDWRIRPAGTARLEELLAQIDLDELRLQAEARCLLRTPLLGVLDTSFLFTGFQSQLRAGGAPPLSLRAAQQGAIRMLTATGTVEQVFDKLDEFAESLGTSTAHLETLFIDDWSPWITVADVEGVLVDDRAQIVADRDPTDQPAAILASLLSPCLILTTDKDFESMAPIGARSDGELASSILAVSATLVVGEATVHVQAMMMVPTLPVAGIVAGVRWASTRAGISPWIMGLLLAGGGALLYRRMSSKRRATTRQVLGELGTALLEEIATAQARQQMALRDLGRRVVPLLSHRTVDAMVLRELAMADETLSAQRLWERLDPATRPAVTTVRETLRRHAAAAPAGRGTWTLGLPLAWLLSLDEDSA